jgi:uncharacterized membrane protein YkvA (DUF1232 family)
VGWVRLGQTVVVPDWLRVTLLVFGVLALLIVLALGLVMWRYRIPPRGLVAMGVAAVYLVSPIDLVPEAVLGPLGLVDDAGVTVAVVVFVYKLVQARRILSEGGVDLPLPGRKKEADAERAGGEPTSHDRLS